MQTINLEHFKTINSRQRLAHALLLIGSESAKRLDFAYAMAATLFCTQEQKPCNQCKSCHLISLRQHPDLTYLEPEKSGGVIKIDQIRELQDLAFRSPQLAGKRIIMLYSAEKMNVAAANALLKLLEEPPSGVYFFLIAEQSASLPATIISRCQQWRVTERDYLASDYLTLAQSWPIDSRRGQLFKQLPSIIAGLAALLANKISICALAEKWLAYEFNHLIELLYLIHCQLIDYRLNGCRCTKTWTEPLSQLAQHFQPIHLFRQLDKLNEINKKIQHNISLNQLLALENFLLGYTE